MRFQFIQDHRDEFPVTRMCQVMNVSPSGYYVWRTRPVSAREMANQELVDKIKVVHDESHETYGSPRIYRELKDEGVACSENRVARLMRQHDIRAKQSKRYKTTTKRNKAHAVAPNVLKRDFVTDRITSGWPISPTFPLRKAGYTWPPSWTCTAV